MRPYGDRGYWETDDYGVPTRIAKLSSKNRRESRRMLHRQGRIDGKRDIGKQLEDK